MTKYLIQFSYTQEGLAGLMSEGGSKRREATEKLVESLGGKLLAYYFSFGDYDGIAIVDRMDNIEVVTAALTATASGAVKTKTTVLLDPDDLDKAVKKSATYRPPGK